MGLNRKVLVITPTTGSPELVDAIGSVRSQTYDCDYLLIVDGQKYSLAVDNILKDAGVIGTGDRLFRCDLPFNTGGGGFYGHRIMAAFSHLAPEYNYVLFLDQDNWYDTNHVKSLVELCEDRQLDWSYSLRKIVDKDKNFITNDNCESLGKWPAWVSADTFLIDTSSYCFKTAFLKQYGYIWDFGWGADRRFFTIVKDIIKHTNYDCSGLYTLNYRLGGNEGSVQPEFFIEGNKRTYSQYKGVYPWQKKTFNTAG